jgi:tellurium resistance protein TerZ
MASFGVKVLHRSDEKGSPDDLDLKRSRYGFGVSWDTVHGRDVDIDLQCVVVDNAGAIIDCAYYNNLKAARGITHSGDEAVGKPDSIEELIWVNTQKLSSNVNLLVFVVAAYSGGYLKDVANGKLHVMEERESNEIALFEMEQSSASVDVVAAMHRDPTGSWKLRIIDLPAQRGQHFMDILPLLSQVIRGFVPSAPQRQKVAFAMQKGGVLDLPMGLGGITVGLGWDVDEGEVDLDVSAVLMDADGRDLEAVFFGRLESEEHGVKHTGDNLTGEGDGDDEQITLQLDRVGPQVQQIFFVVNIYTPHKTFSQVAQPFCRIVDDADGSELCRYSLRDAGRESGLIIAKIAREAGGTRWGFHALGLPCRGRTYKDSLPQIRASSNLKTASLLLRSQTGHFSEFSNSNPNEQLKVAMGTPWADTVHYDHGRTALAPQGDMKAQQKCCAVQ